MKRRTPIGLFAALWATQASSQTVLTHQALSSQVPLGAEIKASLQASQTGSDNRLLVVQGDAGSLAQLEQQGSRNAMSVRQDGGANRVQWRQIGNDLPDLRIVQSGSMALTIDQRAGPR